MFFSSAGQLLLPGPVSCYQGCYGLQLLASSSSSCRQVCSSSVLYGPQALLIQIYDLTHQRHLCPLEKLPAPQPLRSHRAPQSWCSGSWRGCGGSGPPRCTGRTWPVTQVQSHHRKTPAQVEGGSKWMFSFIVPRDRQMWSRWGFTGLTLQSHSDPLTWVKLAALV